MSFSKPSNADAREVAASVQHRRAEPSFTPDWVTEKTANQTVRRPITPPRNPRGAEALGDNSEQLDKDWEQTAVFFCQAAYGLCPDPEVKLLAFEKEIKDGHFN